MWTVMIYSVPMANKILHCNYTYFFELYKERFQNSGRPTKTRPATGLQHVIKPFLRVHEERDILHTIKHKKANWRDDILRRNCLLQEEIEGTEIRGTRGKQLLGELTETKKILQIERESIRLDSLENSLWTCRKTDYVTTMIMMILFTSVIQSITRSVPIVLHYCLARVKCIFYQKHLWMLRWFVTIGVRVYSASNDTFG